jgi:acyl-CoA synthetase (AMP-forming)/AMP-acid ligase II
MNQPDHTLLSRLAYWAETRPNDLAYAFLENAKIVDSLSYGQLQHRVAKISHHLKGCSRPGDRVLLLLDPGLDYVAAFLGCLQAKRIAVTAYAPGVAKNSERLRAMLSDALPSVALIARDDLSKAQQLIEGTGADTRLACMDEANACSAETSPPASLHASDIAFLQYTSGSTSQPKGVMVSHGNIWHNSTSIYRVFRHTPGSRVVSWLPPYHDMGLIGGILQSLFGGFHTYLMSPVEFLKRPYRWLQAISTYGGTSAGGPNFAYQYCVDKILPEHMEGVDLSTWSVAFNGAEAISAFTLDQFAEKFGQWGFDRKNFLACYGLAEATLMATGGRVGEGVVTQRYDADDLTINRATPSADPKARVLAGCGHGVPDQQLRIVDPESRRVCDPGEVGEVCISGPSVALGYWHRPDETAATFKLRLEDDDEHRYLRTGDLGFLQAGELFVSGRSKDLIIVKGANYHPADIERVLHARRLVGGLFGVVAFSLSIDEEERLALAQEVDGKRYEQDRLEQLIRATRSTVVDAFKLSPHAIFLVRAGSLPRTSSGKIQRQQCRNQLSGWLSALTKSTRSAMHASSGLAHHVVATAVTGQPVHYATSVVPAEHVNS